MSFDLDNSENKIDIPISLDFTSKEQDVTDYRCDQCGKFFAASRSLILHKKMHTGIRPYVCPIIGCGKAFFVRAQLVRHSYSHSSVRSEKCSYKNCTSPIKLFKTKVDVRQHIKNWHTLEKSEQRELKLIKKIEKYRKFADNYRKLRDQNKALLEENKRLKVLIDIPSYQYNDANVRPESSIRSTESISTPYHQPRKPVPAYTQFLQEQYAIMKQQNKKLPFTECSKVISKAWKALSKEQKLPYLVIHNIRPNLKNRFTSGMEAYYQMKQHINVEKEIDSNPVEKDRRQLLTVSIPSPSHTSCMICRQYYWINEIISRCGSSDISINQQMIFKQNSSILQDSLYHSNIHDDLPQDSIDNCVKMDTQIDSNNVQSKQIAFM